MPRFQEDPFMASIIETFEMFIASKAWWKEWQNPVWKQFMLTGDAKLLNNLPQFGEHSFLPGDLLSALPSPDQIDEAGKRFLRACLKAGLVEALGAWLFRCMPDENKQRERFAAACKVAQEIGC